MKHKLPFRFVVALIAVGAVHVCIAGVLWKMSTGGDAPDAPPAEAGEGFEGFEVAPPGGGGVSPLPPLAPPNTGGGQVSRPPVSPPSGGGSVHIVAPGESYWGIASRYKTTVGKLRSLNNHSANHTLQPGEKLKVP